MDVFGSSAAFYAIAAVAGACGGHADVAGAPTPPPAADAAEPTRAEDPRFDMIVRADFFRGIEGDAEAFERAMRTIEATLEDDPDHAEALVWRGSGRLYLAGQRFSAGDGEGGNALWEQGLRDMARGVELEPEHEGVRIARGATLLAVAEYVPEQDARRDLLIAGVEDYETALRLQAPHWDRLSTHARGELLTGLGLAKHQLGQSEDARAYFERINDELPDTPYADSAARYLAGDPSAVGGASCSGCHASSSSAPSERAAREVPKKLVIDMRRFRSDSGKVLISVFRSGAGFPGDASKAFRTLGSRVQGGKATVEVENVPAGTYAVAVFHDENGNGKLDTNWIGIPKEGTGASNNAKGVMGPPKFKDAKFTVGPGVTTARIDLVYL